MIDIVGYQCYRKDMQCSGDFSQYQLAGLLQRNKLNQRLEGVEKEMSQQSAGCAPELCRQDGDQQSHSVESQRLVSEDHSHYILIKGSKQSEAVPESRPAAGPWSGSSLSDCRKQAADRPKPLWRPIGEEEEEDHATSFEASQPSVSKSFHAEACPPSPRTLKAIQAAINDSSGEEKWHQVKKDGSMSPRTLLAIQQVLTEEEDGADGYISLNKVSTKFPHPMPQVVISSSEEEMETSPKNNSAFKRSPAGQSAHIRDRLLDSGSEDEMEEVIGQRNKALQFAARLQASKTTEESDGDAEDGRLIEGIRTGSWGKLEKQEQFDRRESEQKLQSDAAASSQHVISTALSPPLHERPISAESEIPPVLLEQGSKFGEATEETDRADMKTESSDGSESESFIEVSEDESEVESAGESAVITGEKGLPNEGFQDETKKEENSEESLSEAPIHPEADLKSEEDVNEETETEETETNATSAVNEWEHFDMEELEALESSLQVEQSNLREQKQQQERMANTVTGQMCLESQELLRIFGVPFLVAPMEAEAQCAALDRADQTHGTITDDSDVWLFGGRHVYKNFFSQNKYVEHYQYSNLQNQLGLDRTKLINLAYLLGSDYTEGVPGVGYVTGMEILNEFPGAGLEPLMQFSKWWLEAQEKKCLAADPRDTKVKKKLRELKLQPGFPNPAVAHAYLQPAVDQSDGSFSWGRPQIDMIKEFCLSRFGWNSQRTEETLQPVIKQLNAQQTQLRIDSFFRMEQQERQAIRSQRLRRAVTCLKRKERGEEKDEDSEEEINSPSKSKKGTWRKGEGKEGESKFAAGGFLGSEGDVELPLKSLEDVSSSSSQEPISAKTAVQSNNCVPQRVRRNTSSSDSSGEDSDDGQKVKMVTARSVFEGSRRGCRGKITRGRGRRRGKKT
ncbi:DNA excision repair protein ERCC-5 homolog isoform 2-T3 [Pholidichthys leucotaenia]